IADIGSEEAVGFLVGALGEAKTPERRREFLAAINEALKGRRSFPMPKSWAGVYSSLVKSEDKVVASLARTLAVTFGDPKAINAMRKVLADTAADPSSRKNALASLLAARDDELATTLQR